MLFLALKLTLVLLFQANANETAARNLSRLTDRELVAAYALSDFQHEALRRRNEHRLGVRPGPMSRVDPKEIMGLMKPFVELEPLYAAATRRSDDSRSSIAPSCVASYNVKSQLKLVTSRAVNQLLHLLSDEKNTLLRAQTWLLLGLLRNFYVRSIAAYSSGEIYSVSKGKSLTCYEDQALRKQLARSEAKLLRELNWALTEVVGQPGIKSHFSPSEIIAQQFVYYQSPAIQITRMLDRAMIEVVTFYIGYTLVKSVTTAIFLNPQIYEYAYASIQKHLGEAAQGDIAELPRTQHASKGMLAFGERLMFFKKPGFDMRFFELERQIQFTLELERSYRNEVLVLAAEAKRLCQGHCSDERVNQLMALLSNEKADALAYLKAKNSNP